MSQDYTALRAAVLTATTSSLLALGIADLVAPALMYVAVLATLAGGAAAPQLSPTQRSIGQLVAVVAGGGLALTGNASGPGLALLSLGPLLCGLAVGQALTLVPAAGARPAAVQTALAGAGAVLALAMGVRTAVVVAAAVTFLAVLAAVGLAVEVVAGTSTLRTIGPSQRLTRYSATLRAGAVALLAAVVVVLVVPLDRLPHAALPSSAAASGGTQAAGGAELGGLPGSGPVDLRARGRLGDETVARVPLGGSGRWRAAVYDTYSRGSWTPRADAVRVAASIGEGAALIADGSQDRTASEQTLVVTPLRRPFPLLLTPEAPTSTDDYRIRSEAGGVLRADPATPYAVTLGSLLDAGEVAEAVDPAWLQLPDSVTPRMRRLAATLDTSDRVRTLRQVAGVVSSAGTYTLDAPVPDAGQDPVDALLFEDHEGFCTQFASAAVVLLRLAGIPARLVTGFAYGDTSSGARVFRESDAHAWAQAWLPGGGWTDVEATPAVSDSASAGVLDRLHRIFRSWGVRVGAALGLVLLALLLSLGLGRIRPRRRQPAGPVGHDDGVLAAYLRYDHSLAGTGEARAPSETLAEHSRRLPEVGGVLARVEESVYSAAPATGPDAAATLDALDRLTSRRKARGRRA